MRIRNFTQKDKKIISRLYCELHSIEEKEKKGLLVPIGKAKLETILLVAEEDSHVVGFVWGNLITYGFSRYGMIEELFVKKEFRNRGIGEALVIEIMKRFQNLKAEFVFVATEKEFKEAINLYKKLGFKLCKGPWFYWFYWNPKEGLPK